MNFKTLWKMENSFWLDGPDFYESSMASDARMVFPSPVGILAGNEIVEALKKGPRWLSVDFEQKTETGLGDTIVLAYKATGKRVGEDSYIALCASTYVKSDGRWVLLAHQQTPEE
ncbi:nuclear transport factor 2 family protein [Neptunicoccus sediminis]|uniref:nuclear transport factor 2 family protein n=1 Tax=Neptunicoccus sediminis TaxID=1892596 RepID=UPI000845CC1F|nr:nuclear transport factor 2 family protein [Neptunicoccus sediminis]